MRGLTHISHVLVLIFFTIVFQFKATLVLAQKETQSVLINEVEAGTDWTFSKFKYNNKQEIISCVFKTKIQPVPKIDNVVEIEIRIGELHHFNQELVIKKEKPKVTGFHSGYYFPEYEIKAAKRLTENTGWVMLSVKETHIGMEFIFKENNTPSAWSTRIQKPSQILNDIEFKGRVKIGYTIFFPEFELKISKEIATKMNIDFSFVEKERQVEIIFTDPETNMKVKTHDAYTMLKALNKSDAVTFKSKLFDRNSHRAARNLALIDGWKMITPEFNGKVVEFKFTNAKSDLVSTSDPVKLYNDTTKNKPQILNSSKGRNATKNPKTIISGGMKCGSLFFKL